VQNNLGACVQVHPTPELGKPPGLPHEIPLTKFQAQDDFPAAESVCLTVDPDDSQQWCECIFGVAPMQGRGWSRWRCGCIRSEGFQIRKTR
jgi:hypothetical protein